MYNIVLYINVCKHILSSAVLTSMSTQKDAGDTRSHRRQVLHQLRQVACIFDCRGSLSRHEHHRLQQQREQFSSAGSAWGEWCGRLGQQQCRNL